MCENARKMHDFEAKNPKNFWQFPTQTPSPLGGGHPFPKLQPLCSNIVDDKTVTEMM